MKSSSLALSSVVLLCMAPFAHAGDLDLRLPGATRFGAPYAPPGTAPIEGDGGLVTEDDGKAHVHGSVTTGIGYAKGHGSSTYNAAHINIDKTVGEDRPMHMNFDLHIEKSDGVGGYYGGYPYDGGVGRWGAPGW